MEQERYFHDTFLELKVIEYNPKLRLPSFFARHGFINPARDTIETRFVYAV